MWRKGVEGKVRGARLKALISKPPYPQLTRDALQCNRKYVMG
jgi:hypothetical protein